jgi:hypothetical protein
VGQDTVVGGEEMRGGAGDGDLHDITGTDLVRESARGEVHQTSVAGAPGHPSCAVVLASATGLDEQFNGASDLLRVLLAADPLLEFLETLVAVLDDGLGHLVVQLGGRGTGTRRILEGVGAGETGLLDDAQRLLEVLLGLSGEARR